MLKLLLATTILTFSAGTALAQTTSSPTAPPAKSETNKAAVSTPAPAEDKATPENTDFVFSEAPDDHVIGSDTAPITMIMYASVTCGHCSHWFQESWPVVKRELIDTDKMRFILRPLPTPPAMMSVTGFLMAECAPEGEYFNSIEYQMNQQEQIFEGAKNGTAQEEYAQVAEISGLNTDEEINACLSDPNNMAHIRVNGRRADAAEVKGVPSFFIGGQNYKGRQEGSAIVALIDGMYEKGQSTLPEGIEPDDWSSETALPDAHDH